MGDIEKSHIDMDIDMSQKRYRYIDIAWSRSRYISNIAIIFCYMKTMLKFTFCMIKTKKNCDLIKGFLAYYRPKLGGTYENKLEQTTTLACV